METNPTGSNTTASPEAAQVSAPAQATPQPPTPTLAADNGTFHTGQPAQASETAAADPAQAQVPQGTPANPARPQGQPQSQSQSQAQAQGHAPGNDQQQVSQETAPQSQVSEEQDPSALPITDWEKAGINTEGLNVDTEVWNSFGKQAVELGLTPRQVEALARWQLDTIAERKAALDEQGLSEIKAEWGTDAGRLQARCNSLIGRVDQALGQSRFSQALDLTGASGNPDIVRGLLVIANALGEDSGTTPSMNIVKPVTEDALSGLRAAFAQARASRR